MEHSVYDSFSDFANSKQTAYQERMDKIRQQAATLAIEDVREGEKLYNTMLPERLLKDESKLGKVFSNNGFFINSFKVLGLVVY